MSHTTTRDLPVEIPHHAALDRRAEFLRGSQQGEFKGMAPAGFEAKLGYFSRRMEGTAVPNMQRLQ